MLDRIDFRIVEQLQDDIPLVPSPFKVLAAELNITEDEYLRRLKKLNDHGVLRRIAAVLRQYEAGYPCNAMVVWLEDEDRADEIGEAIAGIPEVSHCYMREGDDDWPYNMYAMVHARNEDEMKDLLSAIKGVVGERELKVVKSVREFKKTSMRFAFE